MHLFWEPFIEPILVAANKTKPHLLIEIGSSSGANTKKVIQFCKRTNGKLLVIDPLEIGNYKEIAEDFQIFGEHKKGLSLQVLPDLPLGTAYLIDGDHNYYTVFNECRLIFSQCKSAQSFGTILFFHDVAWPYARRDLYYDKSNVPPEGVLPNGSGGLRLGISELGVDGGLNFGMDHATVEGGPKNGVLTAIEDAIEMFGKDSDWQFVRMPSFFGLGIAYSLKGHSPETIKTINEILTIPELLSSYIVDLDGYRIEEIIRLSDERLRVTNLYADLAQKHRSLYDQNFELQKQIQVQESEITGLKRQVGLKGILRRLLGKK